MQIKCLKISLVLVVFFLLTQGLDIINCASAGYSSEILSGTYYVTQYDGDVYSAFSSLEFDGNGSVLWTELFNSDPQLHPPESFNYNIQSDGRMTISTTGWTINGVVAADGHTFSLADGAYPGLFVGIKGSDNNNNASLSGTYYVTQYDGDVYSAFSSLEFDGNGSVLWTELFNSDPQLHPPESFNYNIQSDGRMTISTTGWTINGVVAADGHTFSLADDTYPGLFVGIKGSENNNNSSLTGTYYVTQYDGDVYSAFSSLEFDGNGTVLWTELFNSDPQLHPPETFNYNVQSDGRMTISTTGWTINGIVGVDGQAFSLTDDTYPGLFVGINTKINISAMTDFNADSVSDVLFQNSDDGRLLIWTMNNFTRTVKLPQSLAVAWNVVGKGDFNGDGTADVLYMKDDGSTAIAEMSNSARTNLKFPGGINPIWNVQGVGDFNGDGTDDILWRRSTDGVTMVWGIVNSARAKVSWPGGLATFWDIVGTGDFDADGIDDILCQHNTDGRLLIWKMNNYGRASVALPQSLANTWTVVGVSDFNADGTDDVLYRKDAGDLGIAEFAKLNRSAIKFPGGIGLPWSVKDVGDYNGDGTVDIFFQRGTDSVTLAWGIVNSARSKVAWPGGLATQWVVQ